MSDLTPEALVHWRRDAKQFPCGGCGQDDRILALLDALAAEQARAEQAEAERDEARANARTAWNVHREHVDTTGAIIARHAGDAIFEGIRANKAEAALSRVLADVEALHPKVPLFVWGQDCPDVDHEHDESEDGEPICRACPVEGYVCGLCKDWDGVGVEWPCEHGALVAEHREGQ